MSKYPTVLIVEDELILQDVYKLVLSTQGFQIYTANNGVEGLAVLKKHTPDVVLLDIFMPVMDGKEFLATVNLKDHPNMKVIVYTNLTDSDTEKQMLALGAYKFILKASLKPQDLIALVSECLD